MRRTPLYDLHRFNGATFLDYSGWEIARDFGDPLSEHHAVRSDVGIIDLSHEGKLEALGDERTNFLHSMCTNEVKSLKPGDGAPAAFLDNKGKPLALCRIYLLDQSALISLDPGPTEKLCQYLNKYGFLSDVEFKDVSEDYALISLQGPRSCELLEAVTGSPLAQLKQYQTRRWEMAGQKAIIARISRAGEDGYDIFFPAIEASRLWGALTQAGAAFNLKPVGWEALNILRVEAGLPLYGVDIDETHILSEMAGAERLISYDKGCYTGQEVIARVHFRGEVARKLVGLDIEGQIAPRPGDRIFKDDRDVGHITSAVLSPSLGRPVALAYVHRSANELGTEVSIAISGQSARARVVDLPFYRPNKKE